MEVQTDGVVTAVYGYDGNGNRIAFTGPGGTISGSHDLQDRLLSYGTKTYAYTVSGELELKTDGADTTSYAYDEFGNLTSVTLPSGTEIDYVVDGLNRRVGKKVDGAVVQVFLYENQLNPAAQLNGSGQIVARFVYATRSHVPDYMIKAGVAYQLVTDHLGSVRLVVDATTGSIAQRLEYDAFGSVTLDTNPGFQPFGFAGGLLDQDTGLTRFGARDFDAQVGRWTTKDPMAFVGGDGNLYAYAYGDPVNRIDPTGTQCTNPFSEAADQIRDILKPILSVTDLTINELIPTPIEGLAIFMSVTFEDDKTVWIVAIGGGIGGGIGIGLQEEGTGFGSVPDGFIVIATVTAETPEALPFGAGGGMTRIHHPDSGSWSEVSSFGGLAAGAGGGSGGWS